MSGTINFNGNTYDLPATPAEIATGTSGSPGTYDANGTYIPLVAGTGENAASDTSGLVIRANYNEWKNAFFPKIGELMNMTTYNNPGLLKGQVADAQNAVASSFDNVQGGQARTAARYGMTVSARQQAAQDSAMSLARSSSMVDAANRVRGDQLDRNRAIATGGIPSAITGA